jgi:hypothetical protein
VLQRPRARAAELSGGVAGARPGAVLRLPEGLWRHRRLDGGIARLSNKAFCTVVWQVRIALRDSFAGLQSVGYVAQILRGTTSAKRGSADELRSAPGIERGGFPEVRLALVPCAKGLGVDVLDGLPLLHWVARQLLHELHGVLRCHGVALGQAPEHVPEFWSDVFLPEIRIAQKPGRGVVDQAKPFRGELDGISLNSLLVQLIG